jgi:hypothetical protein
MGDEGCNALGLVHITCIVGLKYLRRVHDGYAMNIHDWFSSRGFVDRMDSLVELPALLLDNSSTQDIAMMYKSI